MRNEIMSDKFALNVYIKYMQGYNHNISEFCLQFGSRRDCHMKKQKAGRTRTRARAILKLIGVIGICLQTQ